MANADALMVSLLAKLKQIVKALNPRFKFNQLGEDESDILRNFEVCINFIHAELVKKAEYTKTDPFALEDSNMYNQIEMELQKQEHLNRLLIKKQLEFKEYQKCIIQELTEEKKSNKKLKSELNKITEQIQDKDLEIIHMSNEKKLLSKDKKPRDYLTFDTINEKYGLEFMKSASRELTNALNKTHQRRRSQQITKRTSSTGNAKKKLINQISTRK